MQHRRLRILMLTPQLPYPPHQGTSIRNYNLLAHLARHHDVELLSFLQPGDNLFSTSPLWQVCRWIETVPAPHRTLRQRVWTTLSSRWPDMALRLASLAMEARLEVLLTVGEYDVVQIEGIEMARYSHIVRRRARKDTLLVFDDHNAEYLLQKRTFLTDLRHPRRWLGALYSLVQWQKLVHYEREMCRMADHVLAVSEADATALRQLLPDLSVIIVPNGVDVHYYADYKPATGTSTRPLAPHALVFTGKMDFRPNVDAVLWLSHEVLPLVQRQIPDAHFYVVGQKPHRRLRSLAHTSSITITGWVEDVRPYIAGAAVYVVPLRMGGGTRLKLLEAMAMGKAIVSTGLGAEGFDVTDGRELLLADEPAAFADAVVSLLRDPDWRSRLGQQASAFARAHYDWESIVPRLEALYSSKEA
ncbi:MAG TPA: glycosyltransferase [Anaerolineae bacterium]|nr:glycosyltransferase [Anaerolineae bacterium]